MMTSFSEWALLPDRSSNRGVRRRKAEAFIAADQAFGLPREVKARAAGVPEEAWTIREFSDAASNSGILFARGERFEQGHQRLLSDKARRQRLRRKGLNKQAARVGNAGRS